MQINVLEYFEHGALSAHGDEVAIIDQERRFTFSEIERCAKNCAAMILQRTRPPLLETPFEVFDQGVFTPNDRFFVRWHWANIPSEVNANTDDTAIGSYRKYSHVVIQPVRGPIVRLT